MTRSARALVAFMGPVNVVLRWVLAALLGTMCVLIGWQVFARFVVGDALHFSEEISRFIMVWLVLLGAAYAIKDNRMIRVDALERLMTGRSRAAVMLTAWIVSIFFYLLLIVFGTSIATAVSYQLAPATGISMSWAIAALPVAGVLMMLNTLHAMSKFHLGIEMKSEAEAEAEQAAGLEPSAGSPDWPGPEEGGDRR